MIKSSDIYNTFSPRRQITRPLTTFITLKQQRIYKNTVINTSRGTERCGRVVSVWSRDFHLAVLCGETGRLLGRLFQPLLHACLVHRLHELEHTYSLNRSPISWQTLKSRNQAKTTTFLDRRMILGHFNRWIIYRLFLDYWKFCQRPLKYQSYKLTLIKNDPNQFKHFGTLWARAWTLNDIFISRGRFGWRTGKWALRLQR